MKNWSDDHPKAKMMSRKRGAILAAAKSAFLDAGYGGTSMEVIAKNADVSIMTLYRHAASKDDLFAAVISSACAPSDESERTELKKMLAMGLGEALIESAMHIQGIFDDEDNVALLRVVLAEAARFPKLAKLAYEGFIGRSENITTWLLSSIEETSGLAEIECRKLGKLFVDVIVGPDVLRVLLGLPRSTRDERLQRAERARDTILRKLDAERA